MQLFGTFMTLLLAAGKVIAAPTNTTTFPTHFGLFMYSLDGTIVNETLHAPSQPCLRNITSSLSTIYSDADYASYGAYAFSIGPRDYLFAHLDGRIATCSSFGCIGGQNYFGGTSQVIFQTWGSYYQQPIRPQIPTCGISHEACQRAFYLQCESEGQPLIWSYCGTNVDAAGNGYSLDVLSWSTIIAPGCIEVEIQVMNVQRYWGNQTYNNSTTNCTDYLEV